MVVLRYGGVYADVDTECGLPLDDTILADDSFVAGWEDDFETAEAALDYKFARQRQILQWVFAATPGHPVLLVGSPPPCVQLPGATFKSPTMITFPL
jgi:mannosyltransferase OCH1-like enzyme